MRWPPLSKPHPKSPQAKRMNHEGLLLPPDALRRCRPGRGPEGSARSWVKLSNRHYDPEKGAALYERYLNQLERAEELGFDGIGVNEHHQTAYGMMPSPIVMASALARRTHRVKICILGSALPLRQHPLTLAEEHAMIDTLTRGRLITGFVRGIGAEYHVFGVDPTTSHERFHEAHDLMNPGLDRDRAVRILRQALQAPLCEYMAAALSAAASAGLDSVPREPGNHRFRVPSGPALHLSANLQPGCRGEEISRSLSGPGPGIRLHGRRQPARLGGAGLCRRDRRKRDGRSQGAFREFPQLFRADAARNAAAARLHLARVDEADRRGQDQHVRRFSPSSRRWRWA